MAIQAPTGAGVQLMSPGSLLDQQRPSTKGMDLQRMVNLKAQHEAQLKAMQAQGQIPLPTEPSYLTRRGQGSFIPDQTQNILSSLLSF